MMYSQNFPQALKTLIILVFCLPFAPHSNAQSSAHEHSFLIKFKANFAQSDIDDVMNALNSTEIWVSPLTETRLWKVNSFPFNYSNNGVTIEINGISGVIIRARARGGVQGSGLNYAFISSNPPTNTPYGQIDHQNDCFGQTSTFTAGGGHNVDLAVFDTGLNLPSNSSNIGDYFFDINVHNEYDYYNFDPIADDENGHGTHMTTIAAHSINKSYFTHQTSYPPKVRFNTSKCFGPDGSGQIAELLLAMEYAILDGTQIINCSWNIVITENEALSSPLYEIFKLAKDNGILVVAAAGNNGLDLNASLLKSYPACYDFDNIITATSYACDNRLASFANYGDNHIDIALPGINLSGYDYIRDDIGYGSGTSHSTALLSGIAANLGTLQNTFDYAQIICAIMGSAESNAVGNKVQSAGLIDANAAANLLVYGCYPNGQKGRSIEERESKDIAKEAELSIYPNPVYTTLNLDINVKESQRDEVIISDYLGQVVMTTPIQLYNGQNSISIDVSELSPGNYSLKTKNKLFYQNHSFMVIK